MPRNRRPQDREAKREQIVAAAAQRFTDDGYEATSMGQIARDADITVNTVYWYFADKDALLVAVLDQLLAGALQEYAAIAERPAAERLLWAVERLRRLHRLVNTVHTRAAASPAIDTWHTGFHRLADSLFADELAATGTGGADLTAMTAIATFVIEGLLTHPTTDADTRSIIDTLARSLTAPPAPVPEATA
ncbi:TetR/AcrR family transcriptional regulator [Actinomadura opuntiae]|uniref:TetR/AcrR family transcriptional regulator n=1 Tax=Actinomadura sp. OS1-43 TaxID=604315 RepID=UPI00255B1FAB|nr:TetR/AcrR family transcriptional regulator [Actinomadura sp. OS1-43]MDL4817362.1 TetR/AcrR family transcriptional regulator [Actinomadura sp. OS1-43]